MKVDRLQQVLCGNYSLATDYYIYGYTSYENLTNLIKIVHDFTSVINLSYFCTKFAAYFFCNYGFPPCDLTSGAPRAICAESCRYLNTHCSGAFRQMVTFIRALGYHIKEDCDNTLRIIQDHFGFPCSSSSLQNECVDLLGM